MDRVEGEGVAASGRKRGALKSNRRPESPKSPYSHQLATTPTRKKMGDSGDQRTSEFRPLFEQFRREYFETQRGQEHIRSYAHHAEVARQNWERVQEAVSRGDDATEENRSPLRR